MAVQQLFGERVRSLRKARGWTQQDLGERAGLNYKYVGAVERGDQNPTLVVIAKLAEALQVRLPELMEFEHLETDPRTLKQQLADELDGAPTESLQMTLRFLRALRD